MVFVMAMVGLALYAASPAAIHHAALPGPEVLALPCVFLAYGAYARGGRTRRQRELWGLAVVYRIRSQQAGPLIQVGVFVTLFLSIGQVPLAVMTGWLHALARVNPATNILRLARQGWIGDPTWSRTWPGLVAIAALTVLLGIYALRGFLALNDE